MSGGYLAEDVKHKIAEAETTPALSEPKKYRVVLLNDDYTPMEFVVEVLKHFFYLNEDVATQVMLQVHIQGRGVCGVYTHDIAETKIALVNDFSRVNQHPLLCIMEQA